MCSATAYLCRRSYWEVLSQGCSGQGSLKVVGLWSGLWRLCLRSISGLLSVSLRKKTLSLPLEAAC